MNHNDRLAMQDAYRAKFARQSGETNARWMTRVTFAITDIHATLSLHAHDSDYAQRLYLELDEARAAYQRATR